MYPCELPSSELLNERANMGTRNNYFVRKRPFSMGWNGGYGFKNSKKIKYRSPREKTTRGPLGTFRDLWGPMGAYGELWGLPAT